MKKIYMMKMMVAMVALLIGTASTSAATLEELFGTYQLTAAGSTHNGENGLKPSGVVTVQAATQEGFDVSIAGLFGQYTWNGLFDEESQTLSFPYGMGGMAGGGMVMMFKVADGGEPATDGAVTMTVNADGTIDFTDIIGVGVLDWGSGTMSIIETIDGGKMEKGDFEVPLLSDDEIVGMYGFTANADPVLADEDEFGEELEEFTEDGFALTITKDKAAGERHFLVSGFFGQPWGVPAVYNEQGKLVLDTNVMAWFNDEDAIAECPYRIKVEDGVSYILGTIGGSLEFDIDGSTLSTKTGMIALYYLPEDGMGEILINIMGGATGMKLPFPIPEDYEVETVFTGIDEVKTAGKATIYTLDGKLVGNSDVDTLPHGIYVVRTAKGTKKVIK